MKKHKGIKGFPIFRSLRHSLYAGRTQKLKRQSKAHTARVAAKKAR